MTRLMGKMMQMPLMISSLIKHAARHASDTEIVSVRAEGGVHRYTWRDAELRARKLAQALRRLGCTPGDRVGTLAWNGFRHLEIYYATSGSELVCHTINTRLFPEQIAWISNDASDKVLCFDLSLLPLVESLAPQLPGVRHFVLMTDRAHMPASSTISQLLCYEELVEAEDGHYGWPQFGENTAASICYTSGTTGNPKGVAYSHRSTVLHTYALALPDAISLSSRDAILAMAPMFHASAWGLPYAAPMVGAKLVLPGQNADGRSMHELIDKEEVTVSVGVPTVWLGLINHARENRLKLGTLRNAVIGGSACPPAMMRALEDEFGVEVTHSWGMTELSPMGTISRLKGKHANLDRKERQRILEKQGKAIFGVDMEIVDEHGEVLPWDGQASGHLMVRGPWVASGYFQDGDTLVTRIDGVDWFPSGDVASIDPDGYMQITDRSKDVIKSGGEWISSIDLENIAMAHPAVHEAAVIACAHPKWDERPLLVVAKKPGAQVSAAEMLGFFEGRIAKWQIPDDVAFVPELPHTATGKLHKLKLRQAFRDYRLPTA